MAKLKGVEDSLLKKAQADYTESDEVKSLAREQSAAYEAVKNARGGADTAAALRKWKSYGAFTYDADADPLYQQAKADAVRAGEAAMEDTVGKVSAMTGGYANSYAATAGAAAYGDYLESLDDELMQYYQLSLDAYEKRKGDALTEYELLKARDDEDYSRLWQVYSAAARRYEDGRDFDYSMHTDGTARAMELAMAQNSDARAKAEFDEDTRRYEAERAEDARRYDADTALKWAELGKEDEQFYASLAEKKAARESEAAISKATLEAKAQEKAADSVQSRRLDAEGFAARLNVYNGWVEAVLRTDSEAGDIVYENILNDAFTNMKSGTYTPEDTEAIVTYYIPEDWLAEHYTLVYGENGELADLKPVK